MRAPASEVSPFDPLFWHPRAGAARRTNPGGAVRPPRVRISRMHPALAPPIDSSLLACTARSRGENDSCFSRIGNDSPPMNEAHQRAVACTITARRYNNPASAKLT